MPPTRSFLCPFHTNWPSTIEKKRYDTMIKIFKHMQVELNQMF